jgi:thiosulfate/3-mercaptopyruvate sulfurtransferase
MKQTSWQTLIDVHTLAAILGEPQLRIIDARCVLLDPQAGRLAYAQSHLPGSVYADLNRDLSDLSRCADGRGLGRHPLPDSAVFSATLGRWGVQPDSQVVVYDAGDGSMAAARLWWMLRLLGHRRVAVLDGGLAVWRAAGLAETADVPDYPPAPAYPAQFDAAAIADADEVLERLGQPPGWLLDARAAERFRGDVEPIDAVAGHVPGAVNRPLALNLRHGRLRSAAELRAELQPLLGVYPPGQVVLMCGSGVTACHLLLALEVAGLAGARIYAGSWSGWSESASRPVATAVA